MPATMTGNPKGQMKATCATVWPVACSQVSRKPRADSTGARNALVASVICEAKAALLRGCPLDEVLDCYKVSQTKLIICLVNHIRGEDASRNVSALPAAPGAVSGTELGLVTLKAARIAVGKHYIGKPPFGMSLDDVRQEVAVRALPRISRWQPGKVPLKDFSYLSCYHALLDWIRGLSSPGRHKFDALRLGQVFQYDETRDFRFAEPVA